MGICLSHISAEECMRYVNRSECRVITWDPSSESSHRFKPTPEQINSLMKSQLGLSSFPIHALIPHQSMRSGNPKIAYHVQSKPLPSGSVIQIGPGIYSIIPELVFIQKAHELSFLECIKQGYRSCGAYRTRKTTKADAPTPLTSADALSAYIVQANGVCGRKVARLAVHHILDNSWSPMETATAMLLCLPRRLGGYGLPKPQLNGLVLPNAHDRSAISYDEYHCDLYWPEANLALEYDSNEGHTGTEDVHRDARRRNSLLHLGVNVSTLTYRQVIRPAELDEVAHQLARQLNVRLPRPNDEWYGKHYELQRLVMKGVDTRPD